MGIEVKGVCTLLQVYDMPRSVAFYRDVIGFEIVTTSKPRAADDFDWGLLRNEGVELMLNTAYESDERPPAPNPSRVASHDDTCLYFGCPDVDAAYERFRSKGVDLKPPAVSWYGMKQLHLKDPDGYALCFQSKAA